MFLGEVRAPQAGVAVPQSSSRALLLPHGPGPDPINAPQVCGKLMEPCVGLGFPHLENGKENTYPLEFP